MSSSSTWFIVGCWGGLILLLQAFWKCPFLEHLLQTASFAGHLSLVWGGDFLHLVQLRESCICIPELLWGFLQFIRRLFLISSIEMEMSMVGDRTTDCRVFMALLCLASVTPLSSISSGSICSFWAKEVTPHYYSVPDHFVIQLSIGAMFHQAVWWCDKAIHWFLRLWLNLALS